MFDETVKCPRCSGPAIMIDKAPLGESGDVVRCELDCTRGKIMMSDEKKPPTPEEVRELAERVRVDCEGLPTFSAWSMGHSSSWWGTVVQNLGRVADDLDERAKPGSRVPFRFTFTPMFRLGLRLSETMKEAFEGFCRTNKIDYHGGGWGDGHGGWSMPYYFTSEEHLNQVGRWLLEKGANQTTEEALEAESRAESEERLKRSAKGVP